MAIGPFSPDYKVRAHIDAELPPDITDLTADVELLQDEVETADTGLLDRATALEADVVAAQADATQALSDAQDVQANLDIVENDFALDSQTVAGTQELGYVKFLTDGVFRKVLAVAAGPNSSTVNTAHGLTAPAKIVGCLIQLTDGTNHLCFSQGGMLSDTIAHSIIVSIDGTNVVMTSGAGGDYSLYAGSIVLLYVPGA